jgi:serine/threonine protein kinase/ABC-type cobalamin/Fe3+-siderophores transport system ATPase subunit
MPVNPYKYNGPLDPAKDRLVLVSRANDLTVIKEGIKKGDFWAILGIKQIGKTTLLRQIETCTKKAYHIHVNFQVSPSENEKNFYQWLMGKFLERIPSENGVKLTRKWRNYSPDLRFVNFLEHFPPNDNKKKIILLFDEIEKSPFLDSLLNILSKIYNDRYQKKVFNRYSVVIAGAQKLATSIVKCLEKVKPFYIKDFAEEESEKLIDKPFERIKLNIHSTAKRKLISLVGGHPQLLQHACYNLVETGIKHKRELNDADVDEAIRVLLRENVTIDTLKEDVKGNHQLKKLVGDIFAGEKEEYHLHKEFSIIGAGSIVEDDDSCCAIRNKVYERFLADFLGIPGREKISYPDKKFEFLEKDSITRFEVITEIGKGGIGVVYKAKDKTLNRMVAIKELNGERLREIDNIIKLIDEAQTTASLRHKNIVSVYDIKKIKSGHIIIMEFVDGEDYNKVVQRDGALTIEEILRVARNLFEALDYSHKSGIIHNDIKPKNIMRDRSGEIKIVDFGISAVGKRTENDYIPFVIGTPDYISPEQFTKDKIDHRSDIYSAGATLFYLVTGNAPFKGDKDEIIHKHMYEPIPSISELRSGIPEPLVHLIEKCMQKEKEHRYQSAEEALRDIDICMQNKKENSKQNDKVIPVEMKKKEKIQAPKEPDKNKIIPTGDKTIYNLAGSTLKIEKPVNQNNGNSRKKTKRQKE